MLTPIHSRTALPRLGEHLQLRLACQFPDDLLTTSGRISPEAYVFDGQDARQRCAAVVLSSGTTGLPKAVMLSHHNLAAICEMLRLHNMDNWRGDMREVFFPVGRTPYIDTPPEFKREHRHHKSELTSCL